MRKNITLPGVPISLNRWMNFHWGARKRYKDIWKEKIEQEWKKDPVKFEEPVSIKMIYRFKDARKRDFDNYTPKALLDGLKETFLIDDDANEHVKELSLAMEFSRDNEETEIQIETIGG